ncbi:MAG: oxidoreductase [Cyclobacteriaceae bacterium]|nr:MAG: oxidoreductase [Cyclobacteriaceae bacterium]
MKNDLTRREFVKGSVAASVTIAGAGSLLGSCVSPNSNPQGLAMTTLGKTGAKIPRIALGLGSRWCSIDDEDQALDVLTYALDKGLYYWDTAGSYENEKNGAISEERIGKILKHRRKEVFISTKVSSRDPDEAMREIERGLKRLQVDQLDMLKVHNCSSENLEKIEAKGGPVEIVHRMKEEGVTRFIGFSGHTEATALKHLAVNYDFDNMLMALNHWSAEMGFKRQEEAMPAADKKGMGVMLMKVVRPIENDASLKPTDLIRYALSLKQADGVVLGTDSKEVVDSNVNILKNFKTMSQTEMDKITMRLAPFYRHKNIPWMEPGYEDGNWA